MKTLATFTVAAALLLLGGSDAAAQFTKTWDPVCGGSSFVTCAAVEVSVSGSVMTMSVRNLTGGAFGGDPNAVFTAIGVFNMPATIRIAGLQGAPGVPTTGPSRGPRTGLVTPSGPVRVRSGVNDTPGQWTTENDKGVGGGIQADVLAYINGIGDGIASDCADPSALPGGSNQLFMTRAGCGGAASGAGVVTFTFTLSGNLTETQVADLELYLKAQNGGPDGSLSTTCMTGGKNANCEVVDGSVVPEPVTLILLGTGLAGMSGAGLLRRRREGDELVAG